MRPVLWVAGSSVLSAVLTFVVLVGLALAQDSNGDPTSGLEAAAVITWSIVVAVLAGASVGLLVLAIRWWRSDRAWSP